MLNIPLSLELGILCENGQAVKSWGRLRENRFGVRGYPFALNI